MTLKEFVWQKTHLQVTVKTLQYVCSMQSAHHFTYRDLRDVGNKRELPQQTWEASTWALGVKIWWKLRCVSNCHNWPLLCSRFLTWLLRFTDVHSSAGKGIPCARDEWHLLSRNPCGWKHGKYHILYAILSIWQVQDSESQNFARRETSWSSFDVCKEIVWQRYCLNFLNSFSLLSSPGPCIT